MDYRKIAEAFARDAKKLLGKDLVEIILFGSVARGEAGEESDIDLLVIVEGDSWKNQRKLADLVVDYLVKYGVYVSPKVVSVEEFEFMKSINSAFYINLRTEGVTLGQ
ncbi:nucleotidyltransferase domain-containing protein [Thermococcus sp. JdF3]|uniref:nucleotidyltransferase domain-containing protein n=1 Tax=Thermococcus sp. JdF3 TaxID=1638258 RepID=UPI00143CAB8B|nr:nucleotidyltransferase domain-containing protein [Thermococcus sp. JdF3]NJE01177.1 nucleotidyltransferase domain-containing protein [Thermococcus sp. JdF3]